MSNSAPGSTFDASSVFSQPLSRKTESRVWVSNSGEAISYPSDAYARDELLQVMESATDLGSMSVELEAEGANWPASYYVSARRSSLLRPFDWDRSGNVLEVGSGCGSITRFLGETFASVVAIEGEMHRAEVGASRSRDQENVAVVCAPYDSLKPQIPFDILFCIGVLEYSPLYSEADDPFLDTLSGFRSRLADDGTLVLAIENQLGLKYFAGAAEDHTAVRYDGIEGYRRSGGRGPRTVGRAELNERLRQAGFENVDFYYPFPDYKLPRAIVSETAAALGGPQMAEFISKGIAGDYLAGPTQLRFDQRAVWHELGKNGLVGDLANSFLVVASAAKEQHHVTAPWDMVSNNLAPRRKRFWSETRITGMADGTPTVQRRRLTSLEEGAMVTMPASYTEPWYAGKALGQIATEVAVGHDSGVADVAKALEPWLAHLEANMNAQGLLPGDFLDRIPQNIIVVGDVLFPIDRELIYGEDLPLTLVVSRGLSVFYTKLRETVGVSGSLRHQPTGTLMINTARALGLDYDRADLRKFACFETKLRHEIEGVPVTERRLMVSLMLPPQALKLKHASVRARRFAAGAQRMASRLLHS